MQLRPNCRIMKKIKDAAHEPSAQPKPRAAVPIDRLDHLRRARTITPPLWLPCPLRHLPGIPPPSPNLSSSPLNGQVVHSTHTKNLVGGRTASLALNQCRDTRIMFHARSQCVCCCFFFVFTRSTRGRSSPVHKTHSICLAIKLRVRRTYVVSASSSLWMKVAKRFIDVTSHYRTLVSL